MSNELEDGCGFLTDEQFNEKMRHWRASGVPEDQLSRIQEARDSGAACVAIGRQWTTSMHVAAAAGFNDPYCGWRSV